MRYVLTLIGLVGLSLATSHAQTQACDTVYTTVEQMPVYKTGSEGMMRDLRKKLSVKKQCTTGESVRLLWTITSEGRMTDIRMTGVGSPCSDSVASRVEKMTGWTPGRHAGKPVCVRMQVLVDIGQ